jgi:NAD(P)-dependent dehydrogenase (short-subunit alcohol dehydrogenase family)
MGWTLVTGGAKRLGAQIAQTLAAMGHNVVIHYNSSQKEAQAVVDACRKYNVKSDLIQGSFSSREETELFVKNYLKQFPDTHYLVNNVGNYVEKPGTQTSLDEWYDLMQTNLDAPFALIKGILPSIIKAQGAIVNMGVVGMEGLRADVHSTAYTISKVGLWMLTRSLAKELASDLVRVNMVSPGYMDISVDLPEDVTNLPMKRAGKPHEVARIVAMLLDKESSYITGQNIEVAGAVRL